MPEVRLNNTRYKTGNGVRNLLRDEQPREKLADYGAEVLTDAELLAILIRSGSLEMNVVDTARHLLEKSGGLSNLARKNWQDMCQIKGIGKVKALTLLAAFELTRRINSGTGKNTVKIHSPGEVFKFFGPRLRDLEKEVFIIGYLNSSKCLTGYDKISEGGRHSTVVDVPEVFRMALLNGAASLVLVHNHPSGNTNPSQADIRLTRRMVETGDTLGLKILDHVIICGNDYYSFSSEGILRK